MTMSQCPLYMEGVPELEATNVVFLTKTIAYVPGGIVCAPT